MMISSIRIPNISSLQESPLKIAVTLAPQIEWVEEIGGEFVEVQALVPSGQSPHSYLPTTTEYTFLSESVAWFQLGLMEFEIVNEEALIDAAAETMETVNLSIGLDLIYIEGHHHENEEEEEEEEEEHYDPHTWLSITRTIQMVTKIQETLSEIDPVHEDDYIDNANDFISRLTEVNTTITNLMSTVDNRHMLIFHPSYGYFCHDYDLEMIALEEDGQDPSSSHYAEVLEEVAEKKVGVIFVQEEISQSRADSFADDAGVEVVQLNPLASNYLENMNSSAHLIAEKLDQAPGSKSGIPAYPGIWLGIMALMGIGSLLINKRNQ